MGPAVQRPLNLVARTDATAIIGAGHAMRCMSLAEEWIALGGQTTLWGEASLAFVAARAVAAGVPVKPQAPSIVDVLVVDTYDCMERESLGRFPAKIRVLVDDMGERIPEGYSVVWNPNPYSTEGMYPNFSGELLVGPSVVPLRAGLPSWAPKDFIGVALGGSDSSGPVSEMLDELTRLLRGETVRALGSAARPGWGVVAPDSPWNELKHARVLVCSASSSLWEAAHVGVPTLVVAFAENHTLVAEWATRHQIPVIDLLRDAPDASARRVFEALRHAPVPPRVEPGAARVVVRLQQLWAAA